MVRRYSLPVLAAGLILAWSMLAARGADEMKYPDWEGQWQRLGYGGSFDPTKPPGRGQQVPLTSEYQAVFETHIADTEAGGQKYNPQVRCLPGGMPRMMMAYDPMEVIVTTQITYLEVSFGSEFRRIYTDGRDWPKDPLPSYIGYAIGKWIDSANTGTYDTLEVETRYLKGLRLMDSSGIPLASDNSTVVKEKLYLDQKDPNILRDEITTIDNAFTRPWTVSRFMRRAKDQTFDEYTCTEDDHWLVIGGYLYMKDGDGYVMPISKNEPPPDPKYFHKYFKETKSQ